MCHYFSATRPGQVRGVSEILPALSLFGQLRRYTSAVIECASRAAEISAVMHTDMLPDSVAAELDALTVINAERNAIVSLPEGWKMSQLKAEQPTTTYGDFKAQIINEIARCLSMPYNVAAGNSSGYNYASGRLDHQTYDRNIEVERKDITNDIIDRLLTEWVNEYATRYSLTSAQRDELIDHEWHFASRDHVDPAKEANADNVRLNNGTLTYAAYYAKRGKDWKREERQRIRERITREMLWNEEREKAGLEPAPYPGDPANVNKPVEQTEDETNDD
jgi:capsid protein